MPAQIRRRCADEQRAQFMNLSRRSRHNQHGRTVRTGEWFRGVPKKNTDDCACEMFVGSGDAPVPPQFAHRLSEWRNHPLEQSLRAQLGRAALKRFFESARVESLDGRDALIED